MGGGQLAVDFEPPSGNPLRGSATSTHIHAERPCDPWGYGSDFTMRLDLARLSRTGRSAS